MHCRHAGARGGSSLGYLALALAATASSGCGGGSQVPNHDGYPTPTAAPWKNPAEVVIDPDKLTGHVEDKVSYPKKKRAKWYAMDVPVDCSFEAVLEYENDSTTNPDADIDLAYELLDGNFHVMAKADKDEQDAGQGKKTRTITPMKKGHYYVHVYTQGRLDEAQFEITFKGTPLPTKPPEKLAGFPAEVAYLALLPAVPPIDDAPPPPPPVRHGHRPRQVQQPGEPPPPEEPPPQEGVRARIAGVSEAGGKTKIIIDRGSDDGVAVGWRGVVMTKEGRRVKNGGFKVSAVRASEAEAVVGLSFDDAKAAGRVMLQP